MFPGDHSVEQTKEIFHDTKESGNRIPPKILQKIKRKLELFPYSEKCGTYPNRDGCSLQYFSAGKKTTLMLVSQNGREFIRKYGSLRVNWRKETKIPIIQNTVLR